MCVCSFKDLISLLLLLLPLMLHRNFTPKITFTFSFFADVAAAAAAFAAPLDSSSPT